MLIFSQLWVALDMSIGTVIDEKLLKLIIDPFLVRCFLVKASVNVR